MNVVSVRGKTVLNLFRVCAIWMSGIQDRGMKSLILQLCKIDKNNTMQYI